MLRVRLTPDQEKISRLLVTPPYKVLVRAGHNVGKSFLSACIVNWWYDTFPQGICLTTAPTDRQVRDILWKEVRMLRGGRGGFPGPKVCRLESSPEHFAHGFTARDGSRFQGHHSPSVLIVFDEAVGVDPVFWEAAQTMLSGERYAFLAIYNPTDQSSRAYVEERTAGYHPVVTMSCLDHPNIQAELEGKPAPYPSSVRLGRLQEMLEAWSTPLPEHEQPLPSDVKLGKQWYRPGPVAEARVLGRWPTRAINSVWSEFAWTRACNTALPLIGPLQIGCDVARYGDDFTAIHARRGGISIHHEAHNGWGVVQVVVRLKALAHELARPLGIDPKRVLIAIDDAGVGGGVTDLGRAEGYTFVPVNTAWAAPDEAEYPNLRSALWFGVSDEAGKGNVSFVQLSTHARELIRQELLAPTYTLDTRGRRVVEPKDDTKDRLGRSPDNADAINLAYANVGLIGTRVAGTVKLPGG